MDEKSLSELIQRISDNTATDGDIAIYNNWCNNLQENNADTSRFEELKPRILVNINQKIDNQVKRMVVPFYRIAIAASVLAFLTVGIYFIKQHPVASSTAQTKMLDIQPGGNKAILTLANGQQINLTAAHNGQIAVQGKANIVKTANGVISYNKTANVNTPPKSGNQYNKLSVPLGGSYSLVLSDGTKVWLNSVSSIKYPTTFSGKSRDVTITGEAYFEVAHNKSKPFHVIAAGQTVTVLGTHFNINAYPEEGAIKTTLLEGSVKVDVNTHEALLKPGQQAAATSNHIQVLNGADTEQAVAWKDGYFQINNADIQTIMREAARWYNIQVVYEGTIPARTFSGRIRKNVNISKLLDMLSFFNVHFTIEGRKIIVKA